MKGSIFMKQSSRLIIYIVANRNTNKLSETALFGPSLPKDNLTLGSFVHQGCRIYRHYIFYASHTTIHYCKDSVH